MGCLGPHVTKHMMLLGHGVQVLAFLHGILCQPAIMSQKIFCVGVEGFASLLAPFLPWHLQSIVHLVQSSHSFQSVFWSFSCLVQLAEFYHDGAEPPHPCTFYVLQTGVFLLSFGYIAQVERPDSLPTRHFLGIIEPHQQPVKACQVCFLACATQAIHDWI